MEEKEINSIDYIKVIWKRKWIIIVGTIFCVIISGIVSFILKPVYEVDSIILPGNFFLETNNGNFQKVVVEDPLQIADKVRHKSYDVLIAAELNLGVSRLPRIKANEIKDTLLARIWVRNHDVELSKKILKSLIILLKEDIDKKIDIEIKNIDTQIISHEKEIKSKEIDIDSLKIEKGRIRNEIVTLGNKLEIIEKRKQEIIAEMKEVKERISNLEKNQLSALKKSKSESETLGLLLYSNEVQRNFQYYNYLQEMFSNKELDEKDINLLIEQKRERSKQLDNRIRDIYNEIEDVKNQIANLKERKGRMDYTKVIKEPTSSIEPVSPKKKLNILVAGILGFLVFTILAFFFEKIEDLKL